MRITRKHYSTAIGILAGLLLFKCCQANRLSRTMEKDKARYTKVIDSIKGECDLYAGLYERTRDSLNFQKESTKEIKNQNKALQKNLDTAFETYNNIK